MKKDTLNKAAFTTARVGFGLAHVLFQSLADATIEAEFQVVKRTGYFDEEGKKHIVTDTHRRDWKEERIKVTKGVQRNAMRRAANAINMIKPASENRVESETV